MTKLEEEVTRLQKLVVENQIEINRLRVAKNDLVQAIEEIERLNDTIHDLRNELFLYKQLDHNNSGVNLNG